VTMTAGYQKIFSPEPRLGFLSHARTIAGQIAGGAMDPTQGARIIVNDRLDATVAAVFMLITVVLVIASMREWMAVVRGRKRAVSTETTAVASAYV